MSKKITLENEFIDFGIKVFQGWGLDTISATLYSMLYLEPREMSIENLAKKTGYSLASVSNKMRGLLQLGMAEKVKKPKSKKVYYFAEKNFMKLMEKRLEKVYNIEIRPAKSFIPELIKKYKDKKKSTVEEEKFKIIKNYYKQILEHETLLKMFEDYAQKKVGR